MNNGELSREELDQQMEAEMAEERKKHGEGDQSPSTCEEIAEMATFSDFAAWQNETYPEVEWHIDGLLSNGNVMILVGPSGAGKSWLALEWALCIAAGRDWNGRTVKQCEVAYLYFEGSRKKFQERAQKIASKHDIQNCGFHPIDGRDQNNSDESKLQLDIDNLESWIVENFKRKGWIGKVKVLFVDPLARLTQKYDENDNPAGTKQAEIFERIAERTGTAVVVVHHTRKKIEYGAHPLEASRGNSAIVSAVPDKLCLTINPAHNGRNGTEKVGRLVGDGRDWEGPIDVEYVWNHGWDQRDNEGKAEVHVDFVAYWLENRLGESSSVKGRDLDAWQAMQMSGGKTTRYNVRRTALCNGLLRYNGQGPGLRWFLGSEGIAEFKKRKDAASLAGNSASPLVEMGDNELSKLIALFKSADDRPNMADLEKRGKERGMTPAEVRELVTLARDKAGQIRQIEGEPVTFELEGRAKEMKGGGT